MRTDPPAPDYRGRPAWLSSRGRQAGWCLALLLALMAVAGCGIFRSKPEAEKSADELYAEAERLMQRRRYDEAAEVYKQVRERFPFSPRMTTAELRRADALFHDGRYQEARAAYQEFEKLHPTHQSLPYVIYQQGLSHVREAGTLDRDQTNTEKAIQQFKRLLALHSASQYASEARARLESMVKLLARHDLYIANFYYKKGDYTAALKRYERVYQEFSGLGMDDEALVAMVRCAMKLKRPEEARQYLIALMGRPGAQRYASEIRTYLQQIRRDLPGDTAWPLDRLGRAP